MGLGDGGELPPEVGVYDIEPRSVVDNGVVTFLMSSAPCDVEPGLWTAPRRKIARPADS